MLASVAVLAGCFGALLIMMVLIAKSITLPEKSRNGFLAAMTLTLVCIAAEILVLLVQQGPDSLWTWHLIGKIFVYGFSPIILLVLAWAITGGHCRMLGLGVPAVISLIFALVTPAAPYTFTVTPENVCLRGDFFWICMVAYASGMLFLLINTLFELKKFQSTSVGLLLAMMAFFVAGGICQLLLGDPCPFWVFLVLFVAMYHTFCCDMYYQMDELTRLLSRQAYESYLGKIDRRRSVVVLIFDVDEFKEINDRYGHRFGDFCLTAIADCIRGVFGNEGSCFRIGGDEFCVILTRTEGDVIRESYVRFLREIESIRAMEKRIPLVSIGCARYNKDQGSIGEAISAADREMYHFKQLRKKKDITIRELELAE